MCNDCLLFATDIVAVYAKNKIRLLTLMARNTILYWKGKNNQNRNINFNIWNTKNKKLVCRRRPTSVPCILLTCVCGEQTITEALATSQLRKQSFAGFFTHHPALWHWMSLCGDTQHHRIAYK